MFILFFSHSLSVSLYKGTGTFREGIFKNPPPQAVPLLRKGGQDSLFDDDAIELIEDRYRGDSG
jgi:hypothetical protein